MCAPECYGQIAPPESAAKTQTFLAAGESSDSHVVVEATSRRTKNYSGADISGTGFHKGQFLALSAAVYAASLADMHQTMIVRNDSGWYEANPLARPLVNLPEPAYYAAGLALATGVNWMSWKMGHSRRWHKLAFLPQVFSIAGNSYGFKSNRYSSY